MWEVGGEERSWSANPSSPSESKGVGPGGGEEGGPEWVGEGVAWGGGDCSSADIASPIAVSPPTDVIPGRWGVMECVG